MDFWRLFLWAVFLACSSGTVEEASWTSGNVGEGFVSRSTGSFWNLQALLSTAKTACLKPGTLRKWNCWSAKRARVSGCGLGRLKWTGTGGRGTSSHNSCGVGGLWWHGVNCTWPRVPESSSQGCWCFVALSTADHNLLVKTWAMPSAVCASGSLSSMFESLNSQARKQRGVDDTSAVLFGSTWSLGLFTCKSSRSDTVFRGASGDPGTAACNSL